MRGFARYIHTFVNGSGDPKSITTSIAYHRMDFTILGIFQIFHPSRVLLATLANLSSTSSTLLV